MLEEHQLFGPVAIKTTMHLSVARCPGRFTPLPSLPRKGEGYGARATAARHTSEPQAPARGTFRSAVGAPPLAGRVGVGVKRPGSVTTGRIPPTSPPIQRQVQLQHIHRASPNTPHSRLHIPRHHLRHRIGDRLRAFATRST